MRCNVTGLSLVEHDGLSGRCPCVAFRATVGGSLVVQKADLRGRENFLRSFVVSVIFNANALN